MKDFKISDDLLSAIIGRKTKFISFNKVEEIIMCNFYINKNTHWQRINAFELAFRCKEWAVKYNFQLVSWTVAFEAVKKKGYCQTHNIQDKNRESDKPFREDTEVEAIIKACEWILENKSN